MIDNHPVVSHDAWIEARKQFLAKEKEFNRLRDELSAERRALPWEQVDLGGWIQRHLPACAPTARRRQDRARRRYRARAQR